MVRKREFNTDEALDAAMHVFWVKGFEATSLTDLTTAMGIQRPSLYGAFGDKKELFERVLRRYTNVHAAEIRARLGHGESVIEAIREVFEQIAAEGRAGDPAYGCFCINTMVELAPHEPKFAVLTREHQMYLAVIFREVVERGVRSGELEGHLNAGLAAHSLVMSMIGLTVLMKSGPDRQFVEQSIQAALSVLQ
ncbi:TetR/AcrR family transcriptional regulator [Paenibacillus barcinonensis]|uniref:TetR family transcriptional regulator n=1 Tax=Paenibacillus barcinonensis TaxID=198119 RepID=A0A2V4W5W8_PAEBA|nr:TetR/AcrR family transcriptional regulator [Paenibacillus barcinonensis]PYE50237.1 TetR family transcriptional regulator [Paenibacillus barcinonensis]QKS54928.1 TetR/AcrR family transcriptional regulator [Paenibacillus barcinonensis]